MKKIKSSERTLRTGATQFEAVLLNGQFIQVSEHPDSQYIGHGYGYEDYSIEVDDNVIVARFYRSHKGNEKVTVENGPEFYSFHEAQEWAKKQ